MIAFDPKQPSGIVWLASYPKSGNTWLRAFLYHLYRVRRGLPREDGEINNIERVTQAEAKFVSTFERLLGKPLAEATQDEVMRVRPDVQAAIVAQSKGIALLKTHNLLGLYRGVPTISQAVSAGAVYMVRDPRDVAVSLKDHIGQSQDFAIDLLNRPDVYALGTATIAGELWGSWSQHVESWTSGADDSLLVIRYEDMLTDPTQAFSAITAHLRQPCRPDQLAEAISASSFGELAKQEEKHGFIGRAPDADRFFVAGKSGRWRDKLSAAQADAIVKAHGPTMARFGYI
jgi:hypothetical protein